MHFIPSIILKRKTLLCKQCLKAHSQHDCCDTVLTHINLSNSTKAREDWMSERERVDRQTQIFKLPNFTA